MTRFCPKCYYNFLDNVVVGQKYDTMETISIFTCGFCNYKIRQVTTPWEPPTYNALITLLEEIIAD